LRVASSTATVRDRFQQRFKHWRYDPPYKSACAGMVIVLIAVLVLTWMQFRGVFEEKTQLTVLSNRSGLSMDPGSKVTFNGVPIGRLTAVDVADVDGEQQAQLTLTSSPNTSS
jgi:phospholipid/cholesterol/gamma-HCH transport system substrate-binding protein